MPAQAVQTSRLQREGLRLTGSAAQAIRSVRVEFSDDVMRGRRTGRHPTGTGNRTVLALALIRSRCATPRLGKESVSRPAQAPERSRGHHGHHAHRRRARWPQPLPLRADERIARHQRVSREVRRQPHPNRRSRGAPGRHGWLGRVVVARDRSGEGPRCMPFPRAARLRGPPRGCGPVNSCPSSWCERLVAPNNRRRPLWPKQCASSSLLA